MEEGPGAWRTSEGSGLDHPWSALSVHTHPGGAPCLRPTPAGARGPQVVTPSPAPRALEGGRWVQLRDPGTTPGSGHS